MGDLHSREVRDILVLEVEAAGDSGEAAREPRGGGGPESGSAVQREGSTKY